MITKQHRLSMKLNKLLTLLLLVNAANAQTTTGKLGPVQKDTLHRIFLPSKITSWSENIDGYFSDLRIFDPKGNEVPYKTPGNIVSCGFASKFTPFHIISKTVIPNKSTSIIVENPLGEIKDLTLRIANAEVTKKFSISGSDDLQNWFGLVDKRELSEITNQASSADYKIIYFPLNNYRYLRFDIDDKKTVPLNIIDAGNIEILKNEERTEIIRAAEITIKELKAQKRTLIHVRFNRPQSIHYFKFNVTAPNYYRRNVRMYRNVNYKVRNKIQRRQEVVIDTFYLDSSNKNYLYNSFFEKEFFIEIDNRDNPPLKIKNIEFVHEMPAIVADLKANVAYTIKIGNPKWKAPDYDVPFPAPKSFDSYPEAKITQIKHINPEKASATVALKFWQQPWFLWLCIAVGGIAILYFSVTLVKDMKQG